MVSLSSLAISLSSLPSSVCLSVSHTHRCTMFRCYQCTKYVPLGVKLSRKTSKKLEVLLQIMYIRMMALTATATRTSHKHICQCLGMVRPCLICESPNQPNIRYSIQTANNIEETFAPLVEEVRRKRITMDKTIVFCRSYDECSHIYMFL